MPKCTALLVVRLLPLLRWLAACAGGCGRSRWQRPQRPLPPLMRACAAVPHSFATPCRHRPAALLRLQLPNWAVAAAAAATAAATPAAAAASAQAAAKHSGGSNAAAAAGAPAACALWLACALPQPRLATGACPCARPRRPLRISSAFWLASAPPQPRPPQPRVAPRACPRPRPRTRRPLPVPRTLWLARARAEPRPLRLPFTSPGPRRPGVSCSPTPGGLPLSRHPPPTGRIAFT